MIRLATDYGGSSLGGERRGLVDSDGLPRLAEQVEWLIASIPGPDGRRYTTETLRAEIAKHGVSVSRSYVGHIRQGRAANISAVLLGALAKTFGVPADFFLDETVESRVRSAVDVLTRARHEAVAASGSQRATLHEGVRALERILHDQGST